MSDNMKSAIEKNNRQMKTECPFCGQHYEIEDVDAGKEADCIKCGKRFTLCADQTSSTAVHCPYCGGDLQPGVKKCRHCGEWLNPHQNSNAKVVFLICALLLGMIGIHNFVVGQKKAGIEKILLLLIALRIITVFAHPLGYTILVTEILWILAEIVFYLREKTFPVTQKKASISIWVTVILLFAFFIYGEYYKGEVDAVEASYSLAFSEGGNCTVEQAHKRMESVMDLPLANVREIANAARKGMQSGTSFNRK